MLYCLAVYAFVFLCSNKVCILSLTLHEYASDTAQHAHNRSSTLCEVTRETLWLLYSSHSLPPYSIFTSSCATGACPSSYQLNVATAAPTTESAPP